MADATFTGLASKALNIANKIAPFAGAAHAWLGDPMADGRGLALAPQFISEVLQAGILKGKIANPLITTQIALTMPDKYPIMSGALAYLGGMIVDEIGSAVGEGKVSSMGSALKKYGSSAAINSIISAWFYLARLNPHGTGATGSGTDMGTSQPAGYGDTVYRTRTKAHIRNSAGPARGPS
jgi:hypothetical protein